MDSNGSSTRDAGCVEELPRPASTGKGFSSTKRNGPRGPVWIAASTHDGEDQQILDAHRQILQQLPNTLLILVPRHPERFDTVSELSKKQNFDTATRSSTPLGTSSMQVFIGDSMGELMVFYSIADIAFVGGSLVPTGGHNLLEPLSLGKPVLFGPHMFNFEVLRKDVLDAQAGLEVENSVHLAQAVVGLLTQAETAAAMGQEGVKLIERNRGATERVAKLAAELIAKTR